MKKVILFIALVILSNCEIKPRNAQANVYSDYKDKVIIAKEDFCTLYKVIDGGHIIYWSVCTGNNNNSSVSTY